MKRKIFMFVLFVLLSVIFCSPSWAATWYVKFQGGDEDITYFEITLEGSYQITDRELDWAIAGERAYFQVILPDGNIGYTRAGRWHLNDQRQIVNEHDLLLEPAVTVPDSSRAIDLSRSGEISILTADDELKKIGQIKLARFINPVGLMQISHRVFVQTDLSGKPFVENPGINGMPEIHQCVIEMNDVFGYYPHLWDETNTTGTFSDLINNVVDDGDTVYVSAGHFRLNSDIQLKTKRVYLYGGFSGTEVSIYDRDFTKNETILDAQKETGRGIFDISTTSVIDGFTITGGNNENIININGNPAIFNCNMKENTGKIVNVASGTPAVINCNITDNSEEYGQGIIAVTGSSTIVNISNCKISKNKGRGIYLAGAISNVLNCEICSNDASYINADRDSLMRHSGGAIHVGKGSHTIRNCRIENNSLENGLGNGGGIFIDQDTIVIISNCTIANNKTDFNGGGIFDDSINGSGIVNCTISNNYAKENGGGICSKQSGLIHCSLVNNTALQNGNEIYIATNSDNNKIYAINSLIWNENVNNIIFAGGSIRLDHCALPKDFEKFSVGNIAVNVGSYDTTFVSDWTPVSSQATVKGVIHTVYDLKKNPALASLKGNAFFNPYHEKSLIADQIGRLRYNPPTIGAIEFEAETENEEIEPKLLSLNVEISSEKWILDLNTESEAQISFSENVSGNYDNNTVQKLKDYKISWNATVTPKNSKINFNNGVLTVNKGSQAGNYEAKVSATVTSGGISKTSQQKSVKINISEVKQNNNTEEPKPQTPSNNENQEDENNNSNNIIPAPKPKPEAEDKKTDSDNITEPSSSDSEDENTSENENNNNNNGFSEVINLSGSKNVTTISLKKINVKAVNLKNCTNLKNIDVAGNTSIQYLNISNTKISSLNVSGCTNLKTLICSQCKISEKNFSFDDCPNLKILILDQCQFTKFDYDEEIFPDLEELSLENQQANESWIPSTKLKLNDFGGVEAAGTKNNNPLKNIRAEDTKGKKLTLLSHNNNEMEFNGMPAKITYDYDTGFVDDHDGNYYMNVTITNSGSATPEAASGNVEEQDASIDSSSGAGCNFNFGVLTFLIFIITGKSGKRAIIQLISIFSKI